MSPSPAFLELDSCLLEGMSEDKEWKWKRSKNRNLSVSRTVCPQAGKPEPMSHLV